jgi:ParB/RepB/Spo0J family partition protein
MEIELSKIVENLHQVRPIFTNEELWELAESIRDNGLLQPVKVRPTNRGYELVYGHRRVAAMRLLGWTKCEAIVEDVSDEDSLVQSLVENLQRQDLDILDEARSYQLLVERGYPLKEIAELVKKPQGRISNRLSILRLPSQIQELVMPREGQHLTTTGRGGLSPDSASRIASAVETPEEAIALAQKAIDERLTSLEVRELTRAFKEASAPSQRERIVQENWSGVEREPERTPQDQLLRSRVVHASEPLSKMIHRKIVWNIHRLDVQQFDHFTIGYSERSLDEFIELLLLAQVSLVVDVRRVPVSRFKPEFSKSNLGEALVRHGIEYVHWPQLGIPSEIRRSRQDEELFLWYDSHVHLDVQLEQHDSELTEHRIAFMCVEVDPQSCHRHRIAAWLEQMGYRLLDL